MRSIDIDELGNSHEGLDSDGIETDTVKEITGIVLYHGCTEECYKTHNEWYQTVICKDSKLSQGCPNNEKYRRNKN